MAYLPQTTRATDAMLRVQRAANALPADATVHDISRIGHDAYEANYERGQLATLCERAWYDWEELYECRELALAAYDLGKARIAGALRRLDAGVRA